ncbi:MAG: hypothetical protein ACYDBT_09830 [Desulfobulbaceae bacterium]
MKIPTSVRNGYHAELDAYQSLKQQVDQLLFNKKESGWHYLSRIKELESYNLKIETGRYCKSTQLDDFFACTLVVENINSIERAHALVESLFNISHKRPVNHKITHKKSDSFPFDDLRIYAKWKDFEGQRPTYLNDLIFEIQIKTFLQHAWGIATHDMIYKSDSKNWAQERVAYQIKAMLEHAEISISEVISISGSSILNKSDIYSFNVNKIIKILDLVWEKDDLPKDKKLLAENVYSLISAIEIKPNELRKLLEKETAGGRGARLLNLSPFAIIVKTLLNTVPEKMEIFFNTKVPRFKLYIPDELELPSKFDATKNDNSVIVNFFSKS